VLTILIILLALVVSVIATQFARRRRDLFPLRSIPAYEALPLLVGESIEADRPMHLSFGSVALGGSSTIFALATAELFYNLAQRAATGAVSPIFTMSDTTIIPLAQDTLRRAYRSRGRLDRYDGASIRWYPSGAQALTFAAALTATMGDERVSSNVLAGSYGLELALALDAAARRGQSSIAVSDRLDGQAIAYAMSDNPLIGEELLVAGAYLDDSATQRGGVAALDILRILLILGILIPTVIAVGDSLSGGAVTGFIASLGGR
jgi:hypothetical protein